MRALFSNAVQVGSGALVYKLAKAHERSPVTTLCIDCTLRRLVSGAVDGSVRMWNLRSGEIIRQLVSAKPTEVTALLHIGLPQHGGILKLVFATGWQRSLRMWYDDDSLTKTMRLSAVSATRGHSVPNHSWRTLNPLRLSSRHF